LDEAVGRKMKQSMYLDYIWKKKHSRNVMY
jgi:hypothetical protein